ncbi:MAG: hypothetical protein LBM13_01460 [Candidatus Ancillula sp.]|nr:hypothetical protein [Candidatus Ancillula sp.]
MNNEIIEIASNAIIDLFLPVYSHQIFERIRLMAHLLDNKEIEEEAQKICDVFWNNIYQDRKEYIPPKYLNYGQEKRMINVEKTIEELSVFGVQHNYLEQARKNKDFSNEDITQFVLDYSFATQVAIFNAIGSQIDFVTDSDSCLKQYIVFLQEKFLPSYKELEQDGVKYGQQIEKILQTNDKDDGVQDFIDLINEFAEQARLEKIQSSDLCDFCMRPLSHVEYDRLHDGRTRCIRCSKTVIKDQEEFERIYVQVVRNLESFFNIGIRRNITVKMVNSKELHKAAGTRFQATQKGFSGRILGFAQTPKRKSQRKEGPYLLMIENGSPALPAIATMAHELTHIWQYQNWDEKRISRRYGKAANLPLYEGMAKWAEIQYLFNIKEFQKARYEVNFTLQRQDEYGIGFRAYLEKYGLDETGTNFGIDTPFKDLNNPL